MRAKGRAKSLFASRGKEKREESKSKGTCPGFFSNRGEAPEEKTGVRRERQARRC